MLAGKTKVTQKQRDQWDADANKLKHAFLAVPEGKGYVMRQVHVSISIATHRVQSSRS